MSQAGGSYRPRLLPGFALHNSSGTLEVFQDQFGPFGVELKRSCETSVSGAGVFPSARFYPNHYALTGDVHTITGLCQLWKQNIHQDTRSDRGQRFRNDVHTGSVDVTSNARTVFFRLTLVHPKEKHRHAQLVAVGFSQFDGS